MLVWYMKSRGGGTLIKTIAKTWCGGYLPIMGCFEICTVDLVVCTVDLGRSSRMGCWRMGQLIAGGWRLIQRSGASGKRQVTSPASDQQPVTDEKDDMRNWQLASGRAFDTPGWMKAAKTWRVTMTNEYP